MTKKHGQAQKREEAVKLADANTLLSDDKDDLMKLYAKFRANMSGSNPRVMAMALTAHLSEVIADYFMGNDEDIFVQLRSLIAERRKMMGN